MDKQKALDTIAKEIANCEICKQGKSGLPVPGEGDPDAEVMFIGEAPGKQEAATGRPFIGRSGKLLRSQINAIGLSEKDVYITSPVKYLPDRGTPTPLDIAHGRIHLMQQIDVINPKVIVLLGRVAAEGVLEKKISITKIHGTTEEKDGRTYFFMFHPAAALRIQKLLPDFKKDFEKLKQLLGH